MLSRRAFLKYSSITAASLALPYSDSTATPASVKPKRVVVVGAGIAGLVAAYELMNRGHEVHVPTLFPHVATSEGRFHFAGEHTATSMTMEGAAQSGLRVANEVSAATV